jgi:prophage maintenance system killer protein
VWRGHFCRIATPGEAVETILALAAGSLSEDALAAWVRKRMVRTK